MYQDEYLPLNVNVAMSLFATEQAIKRTPFTIYESSKQAVLVTWDAQLVSIEVVVTEGPDAGFSDDQTKLK